MQLSSYKAFSSISSIPAMGSNDICDSINFKDKNFSDASYGEVHLTSMQSPALAAQMWLSQ